MLMNRRSSPGRGGLVRDLANTVWLSTHEHDLCPAPRQLDRGGPADPARRAGQDNERHASDSIGSKVFTARLTRKPNIRPVGGSVAVQPRYEWGMPPKLLPLVAVAAFACALPATALAKVQAPPYYLALGDSLSVGVQPNAAGKSVPTSQGYSNDLYATAKHKIARLKLMELGCPGESTTSMIKGGPFCKYSGSQLSNAVKFIRQHRIAFITLDIGANDVDGCATSSGINGTCIANGINSIKANVPRIVNRLRKAAGRKVRIAGMTYYDPFLAEWLTGSSGQTIAQASVSLAQQINGVLATDFKAKRFRVADVATAFDTYVPFTTTTMMSGQTVPLAVAKVCQLTWICTPAPRGPNIHANAAGYREIATVFKQTLG